MLKIINNTIALTFLEVVQSRVYQVLLVMALLSPLFAYFLSSLFLVEIGKVYMDGVLAAVHFLSVIFTLFIVSSILVRDISHKVCYLLVVQPATRESYLMGRFFGFLVTLLILITVVGLVSIGAGFLIFLDEMQLYVAGYTWSNISLLIFLHSFQYVSLLGFIFFIVSWATGLAEVMFFSMLGLTISWALPQVLVLLNPEFGGEQKNAVLFEFLRTVYQILPHLNGSDISLALTHGASLSFSAISLYILEHLGYAGVFLGLAVWVFNRRDL